jgi:hypothetical protein
LEWPFKSRLSSTPTEDADDDCQKDAGYPWPKLASQSYRKIIRFFRLWI